MNELIAIEPAALATLESMRYLMERFGFHEGRFIAEYPNKRWEKMVYEEIDRRLPDVEAKKVKELFVKYRHSAGRVASISTSYDQKMPWHTNACAAKQQQVIADAIVEHENDMGLTAAHDIDEEYFTRLGGRQIRVLSSAHEYAKLSERLLATSHEVIFFDPYIITFANRFKNVMLEMARVSQRHGKCKLFKIFTLRDRFLKESDEQVIRGANAFCKAIADIGVKVELNILRDIGDHHADDHGRYLFSIKGGMQFDHGFDEEAPPKRRLISMLDRGEHDRLWKQFMEGELPFALDLQREY